MKGALAALAAVTLILSAFPGAAQGIEGSYALQGLEPEKTAYAGKVTILKEGVGYRVTWTIDSESTVGAGMLEGDLLAVGYVTERRSAINIMRRQADGSLKGRWYIRGNAGFGEETWVKQ